jgi:hypothetical protein
MKPAPSILVWKNKQSEERKIENEINDKTLSFLWIN